MNDERWTIVDRLLGAALEREPHDRAAFLREACGGDEALRLDVESLVAHASSGAGVVSTPVVALADELRSAGMSMMGRHVGPYAIGAQLGAGGMGEVYRARDTKLGRDVAIKILPRVFTSDPDRRARLDREARLLAALNHPHIGAIYGLEEMDGMPALILELVEGDTLAERIAKGPLPIKEALTIAHQIADALDTAHEKGIVHRDLKPANIKITPDGIVKVLDFGLAKAALGDASGPDLTQSPTLTVGGTRDGVILGTAAYMSPEQARGKAVDKRADIWAFGCVLYEMLTGTRPFLGEDVSDTLAAVLRSEPDWSALPANTPSSIRRLLRRALQKDRQRRLADMADARFEIEEAGSELSMPVGAAITTPKPSRRREYLWAAVALLSLLAAAAVATRMFVAPAPEARVTRFHVFPPEGATIEFGEPLSPDGRLLAFAVASQGKTLIWIRPLDSVTARPLPGTDEATRLFWSPDSKYIAFFAQNKLKKVLAAGGPPQVISNAAGREGAWSALGDVILIGGQVDKPLLRVSAAGGQPTEETELDASQKEISHDYPDFLPDGRHYLYMARSPIRGDHVTYLGTIGSKERRELPGIRAGAKYFPTGHVVFIDRGTLMAQRFDISSLELSGEAFPIAEQVAGGIVTPFSASTNGTFAYVGGVPLDTQLAWFDRNGKQLALAGPKGEYTNAELSRDSKYVAFNRGDPGDIWILDIEKGRTSKLTSHAAADNSPVWSPDGHTVAFRSNRDSPGLYEHAIGVVGEDKQLLNSNVSLDPSDWSRDGSYFVYHVSGRDLWALPLFGDRKPLRMTETPFNKNNARISPDGRWVAYRSDESGKSRSGDGDVYIQSFPQAGKRQQISTAGGFIPRWSHDGEELFFVAPDFTLMAVSIQRTGSSLEVGAPRSLFKAPVATSSTVPARGSYNVSEDGRFLLRLTDQSSAPITVVLNWASGLKK